jgi:hypothetical protein
VERPQTGPNTAEKSSKPTQSPATQEQRKKRRFFVKLDSPHDLRTQQSAEQADKRRISAVGGQIATLQFRTKYP